MSDPVELAEKKSGKSKNSKVSSKKSNEPPQTSSEKGEIKSQHSQNSKNSKNSKNPQVNNNKEEVTQKVETKPIEESQPETQNETQPNKPIISVRAYLEQNVASVVQEALLEVARQRPPNPLQFVGNYILERANAQ